MSRGFLVPILLPADPVAAMEAATKQYVDSKAGGVPVWVDGYPTYDPRYVNVTGDTMTGSLVTSPSTNVAGVILRRPDESPSINWQLLNATRLGYMQVDSAEMRLYADGTKPITFFTGGTETFRIRGNATGEILTVAGNPGAVIYFRDTIGGNAHCYVGGDATWGARLTAVTRDALIQASAGDTRIQASANVDIYAGGTASARFHTGTGASIAKMTTDVAEAGHYFNPNYLITSNNVANTPMLALNKFGGGLGAGHDYVNFRKNNTNIGSITRNASTAAVLYNTTSDYRMKHDRGLITGALERIKVLKPRRVVWKSDPTQTEMDGFFAHEVAEAVPDAVTGVKDAVSAETDEGQGTKEGQIIPQQLDPSRLIPLLVAAVQDLAAEVAALKAQLAAT